MFDWLKKINKLDDDVTEYKKDSGITAMPAIALVNRAKKLIEENKLDEAEKILETSFSLAKEESLAYKYLGIIYDRKKQFKKSIEMYQHSADLNPEDKDIWKFLGTAFLNEGNFEKSIKAYENANKITPLNTDIYTGWGLGYMKMKNYQEARNKFVEAIKLNRYNSSALFFSAICESKIGMLDLAESKLKFLVSMGSNDINYYEYANIKFLKGNYNDAIFNAKKSIEFNPKILPAYILLIKIYSIQRDLKNCKMYYEKAVENDLSGDNLNENYGLALFNMGQFKDSKLSLLKAYENNLNSENITSKLLIANLILENSQYVPLLTEKLTSLNRENLALRFKTAVENYKNDNVKQALESFRKLKENFEQKFIIDFFIALCYEKLSNPLKTKEYFESSIEDNPLFLNTHIEFANHLLSINDPSDAQRKLRKALKIFPDNVDILNLMFHSCYILVKDNVCEYNIKEAMEIANKITDPEKFKWYNELEELRKIYSERDLN